MTEGAAPERITKDFAVFDCDAHINDPLGIWEHVPKAERELVRATYWKTNDQAWLNGEKASGGGNGEYAPAGMYNPICIAGPQMNKKIVRRLASMIPLTAEQRAYLEHKGATDPKARIRDLDLMGIDQVLVIPTKVIQNLPFADNVRGVDAFCRAYNNFALAWCGHNKRRLFPAALLPLQSPEHAVRELERVADKGFKVALMRPFDAAGRYPNDLGLATAGFGIGGDRPTTLDNLFRAFEATDVVLGMHTFPAHHPPRTAGPGLLASPGELVAYAGADSQTLSFIFEIQVWLAQVLLCGFLDRYPHLKMAVFESNSQWLPGFLATCDRLFELYANERKWAATRLPSEAFHAQCVISFESDETQTMRQWDTFENVGIWASDCYHHDGADSWSAIRAMRELDVPEAVQAKLLGGNARRMYGIDSRVFVTNEPAPITRPDWFPGGQELDEWAEQQAHPRRQRETAAP
jgi:uncharacterized protein